MCKVFFSIKESKGMHKVIQLISNFLYNKNMPLSMKIHVHWMNLMKNQIKQFFWKFEGKGCETKGSFFKPFDKTIMFNGFKMSNFNMWVTCARNNLARTPFGCPLKLILGFLMFLALKQNIHTQLCMNVKSHH